MSAEGAECLQDSPARLAQEPADSALSAFILMLAFLGRPADPDQLRHSLGKGSESLTSTDLLILAKRLSLEIAPGEVIGIVGSSGSGKSTLAKLVQRLRLPEQGRVLIDGVDLAMIDPSWLRRQLGVVLQENILFNRTARENIALSDPAMPMENVVMAAELAGAHEFILELPEAYDTQIDERGTNLSGGQRQRIAIARALAVHPKILIFDEATSALDAESEEVIQKNLRAMASGRTVIIIAHRLSAVRQATVSSRSKRARSRRWALMPS
jgi:subfamily B ATP-binding cassette protein HlyB/CyaB